MASTLALAQSCELFLLQRSRLQCFGCYELVQPAPEVLEEFLLAQVGHEPLEVPEAEEGLDRQAREDRVPLAKVEAWHSQRL